MRRSQLFILTLLFCWLGFSQKKDSISTDKPLKLQVLPVLFYLPETGLGYGALGVGTWRFKNEPQESRPSSAQVAISLTTKNQFLLFAPFELYFKNENWRVLGELGYYKYFYNFYGLGDASQEADFETYGVTFPRFRATLMNQVMPNVFVGMGYELDSYSNLEIEENGILDATQISGKNGGGIVSNLGLRIFYDSRDNIFFPTKGFFIEGSAYTGVEFLGSSFAYSKFISDNRYYQQLKGNHILAANAFLGITTGDTPLYELFNVGSRRTRGFNDRRFQDNNELSLALEYRFPIAGRFGGVTFVSSGTVASNFNGLFNASYKNSGGLGLRYLLNKDDGIRIRVDYGLSSEGGNLYFTVREAF